MCTQQVNSESIFTNKFIILKPCGFIAIVSWRGANTYIVTKNYEYKITEVIMWSYHAKLISLVQNIRI